MTKIENLELGHTRHGLDKRFIVKISDVHDDRSLETGFPHRHNFYMICLVVKGTGTHVIDFEKIEIKPRRLFFIRPEQVHFWELMPGSKLAVVQFSIDFLTDLFDFKRIPAIRTSPKAWIDLKHSVAESFLSTMERIEKEHANLQFNSFRIIQSNIFILLSEIDRLVKSVEDHKGKASKFKILDNYRNLIEEKFREITSVNEFACILNITPNYLNIIVKETMGLTATELLHRRVILEAKRLLINERTDIVQVAYELGFKDASYFSRFFKRSAKQSPSDFRNSIYKMYQHQQE